ncbi:MAG: hypothetical protein GY856_53155 [bacterium]|nr:hypothetical protein [bacterium]
MASNNPLSRVLVLAIAVAVAYLVYSQGIPWFRENFSAGSGTGGEGKGSRCVEMTAQANRSFSDRIGEFLTPPRDLDAWQQVRSDLESQIDQADSSCRCALESCRKGAAAVTELRDLVSQFDLGFQGGAMPINGARQMERIDQLLSDARTLVRQEK